MARLMPSLDVFFNLTSFFPTVPDDVTIERAELRVFKIPGPVRWELRLGPGTEAGTGTGEAGPGTGTFVWYMYFFIELVFILSF